jgi:hypothetical protein
VALNRLSETFERYRYAFQQKGSGSFLKLLPYTLILPPKANKVNYVSYLRTNDTPFSLPCLPCGRVS